jgi:hypothetical protein
MRKFDAPFLAVAAYVLVYGVAVVRAFGSSGGLVDKLSWPVALTSPGSWLLTNLGLGGSGNAGLVIALAGGCILNAAIIYVVVRGLQKMLGAERSREGPLS